MQYKLPPMCTNSWVDELQSSPPLTSVHSCLHLAVFSEPQRKKQEPYSECVGGGNPAIFLHSVQVNREKITEFLVIDQSVGVQSYTHI